MMTAPEAYLSRFRNSTLKQCLQERDEICRILKDVESGRYDESEITETTHPAL